jgi:hypothetical protein
MHFVAQAAIVAAGTYLMVKCIRQSFLCRSVFYFANGMVLFVIPVFLAALSVDQDLLEDVVLADEILTALGLLGWLGLAWLARRTKQWGPTMPEPSTGIPWRNWLHKILSFLAFGTALIVFALFVAGTWFDQFSLRFFAESKLLNLVLVGLVVLSLYAGVLSGKSSTPFLLIGWGSLVLIGALVSGSLLIAGAVACIMVGGYWRVIYLENHPTEQVAWTLQLERAKLSDLLLFYRGFSRLEQTH